MDNTDKKILHILARNADATSTDIGEKVGLSIPAVNKRIAKMKKDNIIKSTTVITNAAKVNKPIVAFIFLVSKYESGIKTLMKLIADDPDILECHAITGEYDYLIKVCAESVAALEKKLLHMKSHKCVIKSHTMLSLLEHKYSPAVLPDIEENEDNNDK